MGHVDLVVTTEAEPGLGIAGESDGLETAKGTTGVVGCMVGIGAKVARR